MFRPRPRLLLVGVFLAALFFVSARVEPGVASSGPSERTPSTSPSPASAPSHLAVSLLSLRRDAETGLTRATSRWWRNGWFIDDTRGGAPASIWPTVHLLEAVNGLTAAERSPSSMRRAVRYATEFEGYWDPALGRGSGGFSTFYGRNFDFSPNWFDDNGWLGLAFLDSYWISHQKRFLRDAERAFHYVYRVGWDSRSGGIWWNNRCTFKAGESVVTAALLASSLYQITGEHSYLRSATRIIDWANANIYDPDTGLYTRVPLPAVSISYLESPMLDAMTRLCQSVRKYCDRLEPLTRATLASYGGALSHAPQYDAMYVKFLADTYSLTKDERLFRVVYRNALRASRNATSGAGLFLHGWDGAPVRERSPSIQLHAATLEALAWAAAAGSTRSP